MLESGIYTKIKYICRFGRCRAACRLKSKAKKLFEKFAFICRLSDHRNSHRLIRQRKLRDAKERIADTEAEKSTRM